LSVSLYLDSRGSSGAEGDGMGDSIVWQLAPARKPWVPFLAVTWASFQTVYGLISSGCNSPIPTTKDNKKQKTATQ